MISVLGQQLWKATLVSGVLTIVLGVMVLVWPGPSILVASTMFGVYLLALWIGTGFIVLGVSENAVALSERDLPRRGWYVVLGLMSVIAGGIVLVWPFDSIVVLTIVSGVSLVVLGFIQIVQAFQIRRDAKAVRETFEALSERVAA